jgi:type I restriction enzyme R subunit
VVGAVTQGSAHLREFIEQGKKIIISTIQKFPIIVDAIGDQHRERRFALIIDEAHSSQGGRTAAAVHATLAEQGEPDDETDEDRVNRVMESRKVLKNASYFAFTATPKNKTLEIFGARQPDGSFRPFHGYTMKQAIEEGFILDLLKSYTPVASFYRLMKKVEDDPEFDSRKAQRKLRKYVESHDHAIRQKAEIMVDHFHDRVIAAQKIGGKARAMVVTSGIARALQYKTAFDAYLAERKSPYKAIIAFSGEQEVDGRKVTEATLNGFASTLIPEKFREGPYRFLIVADKFQTGYDEPLLHTMYVDKVLSGIKAVQILSRLNRAHPHKQDTFILDFMNDVDTIQLAFADYYRTTVLSEATDPDKLHDLKADLDGYQVYAWDEVVLLSDRFLKGADRDQIDPILDACVARYTSDLDEDGQVDFKGKAKAFVRTYSFLSAVLPYSSASWERLAIFLSFLAPRLPAPREEDLAKGILETIDMDSYRVEVRAQTSIALPDEEATIEPVPTGGGGGKPDPAMERLSAIVRTFNDQFGNIEWKDKDKIYKVITEEIPAKVGADKAYQNAMKHSDKQNARIEHDNALGRVMLDLLADHTELFKLFSDDPGFKKKLSDAVFQMTYRQQGRSPAVRPV